MSSTYNREIEASSVGFDYGRREQDEFDSRRAAVELPPVARRPLCRYCANRLRPYSMRGQPGFEGRLFGDYGDNEFCGLRCGYHYALRALAARR